ncbi:MAG: RagB/SusD family nutrient uptake outer membrane protein [Bacteroidota bacterium]
MQLSYKFYCGLLGLLSLTACGADYLDEAEVFRDLEASTFYQTQDDAVLAVNAAYSPLQYQAGFRRYPYLLDYMSGDLNITSGGRQLTAYPGFQFNAASQHLVPRKWTAMYTGISRANVVLDRVPDIDFTDNDLKERVLGEAHFLRAFYYIELVKHYGGVPLYERPFDGDLTGELFRPSRASTAEVYALIESDLRTAAASLPNSYGDADLGRATAGAAQAYLGEALLYQEKYAEAAAALKRIIDGEFGDYELVAFGDNFSAGTENNAESVFEVQYATGIGRGFSDGDASFTAESNWLATALNPGRVRAFANGLPSVEIDNFFRQFPEEDTIRRLLTIARPGDVWGTWNPIAEDPIAANQWRDRTGDVPNAPFLGVRKGTEGPFPIGFVQSPINFRTMRFAEVLLLFAEAENEANGPTAAAYAAINRVRERAAVDPLPAGLDKDGFFARVATERRLELTFEFKRFFDLIRWTRRAGTVPDFAQPGSMPGFIANKNEVLPIPEGELVANPNLTQNPGY